MCKEYTLKLIEIMYYLYKKDKENSDKNKKYQHENLKCNSYLTFQKFIKQDTNKKLLDQYSDILSDQNFLNLVKQDTEYFNIFIDAIKKYPDIFTDIKPNECVKILTNFLAYKKAYHEHQKKFPHDNALQCIELNQENVNKFLNDDEIKKIQQKTEENNKIAIKEIKDMICKWTTDKWRKNKIQNAKTFDEIKFIINTPGIYGGTSRAVERLNSESNNKNSGLNTLLNNIPKGNSFIEGKYISQVNENKRISSRQFLLGQFRCAPGGQKATPNIRPRT